MQSLCQMQDWEIDYISGGLTENQCIGISTFAGGVIGGIAGIGTGPGIIAVSGFGMAVGAAFGMVVCGPLLGGLSPDTKAQRPQ